jgi:hypothetical protein
LVSIDFGVKQSAFRGNSVVNGGGIFATKNWTSYSPNFVLVPIISPHFFLESLMDDRGSRTWVSQWVSSPVLEEEPCRGCLSLASVYRSGNLHAKARSRALEAEVRDTPAGAYCLMCFLELPSCPECGKNPTSHIEYPCIDCELKEMERDRASSGGRVSSNTYRGWSTKYHGVLSDGSGSKGRYWRKVGG